MKKKIWMVISVVALLLILSTILILTKPNESDYARWMESNYNVQCLDFNCNAFDIRFSEDGTEKVVTMTSAHGGYSPGIFVMRKEMVYRNLEDSSYILDLKVKGWFGKISIVDEKKQLSNE